MARDWTARRRPGDSRLLADAKSLNEIRVSLGALTLKVVEEAPPLTDEHQEPSARVVIFGVNLEVLGQVADALAEDRDLHFR